MEFIQQMRDLLDRITEAREAWDREQAEQEMAQLIKHHMEARRRLPSDFKVAQHERETDG
jgi:hypothetical protein